MPYTRLAKTYHDQDRIGIKDSRLRLKKNAGTYKDFGKTFCEVWYEAFINYTAILAAFYGATARNPTRQ